MYINVHVHIHIHINIHIHTHTHTHTDAVGDLLTSWGRIQVCVRVSLRVWVRDCERICIIMMWFQSCRASAQHSFMFRRVPSCSVHLPETITTNATQHCSSGVLCGPNSTTTLRYSWIQSRVTAFHRRLWCWLGMSRPAHPSARRRTGTKGRCRQTWPLPANAPFSWHPVVVAVFSQGMNKNGDAVTHS